MQYTHTLTTDHIPLNKLLKLYGIGDSGAQAKHMISQGLVLINGEIDLRIRRKLVADDIVSCGDDTITVE